MIDVALVVTLFVLVWVAVLLPPAARGSVSRREAFEQSLREEMGTGAATSSVGLEGPSAAARRRQVLGGLLVAIAGSLFFGLLPTFRIMLVVHLLLVNSFLAFLGFVVFERDRRSRPSPEPVVVRNNWSRREERAVAYRSRDLSDVGLADVGLTA